MVSPTNGFAASGPVGGPFSVTSQNYSLTNQSGSSLPWGIINTSSWLSASPSGGTLAGGAKTTMTVSLTAAANSLAAGIYTANVLVTNPTGVAASLPFTINVGQSIVNNGGFETGNFSGWTLNGSSRYNFVTTSSGWVHSGSYGAALGAIQFAGLPFSNPGHFAGTELSALPVAGQSQQPSMEPPPINFSCNGMERPSSTRPTYPFITWTNLQFIVTATSASTVLQVWI